MNKNHRATAHDLTGLWDQLSEKFLDRAAGGPCQGAVEDSIAAMHLTAHLVCRFIGDPRAVLRPTMTLPQLADRLRREITPAIERNCSCAVIETFGLSTATIADSRWLLALWTLVMDMVTSTHQGTRIEVNIGTCADGFEIEVGYDEGPAPAPDFGFEESLAARWLAAICPEWTISLPSCPLGGLVVQVNIPQNMMRRAA